MRRAGAAVNKDLTFKLGQAHVQRYLKPLFEKKDRKWRDRPLVWGHTRAASGGRSRGICDVQEKTGRVYKSRLEILAAFGGSH